MSDSIHLDDYHQAVADYLIKHLPWLTSVTSYPETETQLTTPCAFFQVMSWEKAERQPMNGQLAITLDCEIIAVLGMENPKFQQEIRNAAMALSLKVDQACWGLPIQPAVLASASPESFSPELDGYAVWTIEFKQQIEVGDDMFKPSGLIPTVVNVGYHPDAGADNTDLYEQVITNE